MQLAFLEIVGYRCEANEKDGWDAPSLLLLVTSDSVNLGFSGGSNDYSQLTNYLDKIDVAVFHSTEPK